MNQRQFNRSMRRYHRQEVRRKFVHDHNDAIVVVGIILWVFFTMLFSGGFS